MLPMEIVTSRENQAVKAFCRLSGSKKQRDLTGTFALESIKLLLEAFENRVRIEKVFLTEAAEEKYREKLFELLNSGIPVVRISEDVSRKMSEAETPQGVFAVCGKLDKSFPLNKIDNKGVYTALCGLQDPGNIGTILRTAEALGVCGVLMSGDCCDIYNPKVLRASMGTVFRLPIRVCEHICAELKGLSLAGISTYAAVVNQPAESLSDILFERNGVAVIGNEGNGLPQEIIDACDRRLTIAMRGNAESLNAAMAAGIILWQMTK